MQKSIMAKAFSQKQIKLLALLNILDLLLTLYGLQAGYIEEGNPLLASLYRNSPVLFAAFKLVIVLLLLAVINYGIELSSHKRLMHALLYIPIITYGAAVLVNVCFYIIVSVKILP